MKEAFFTIVALSLPILLLGGVVYLFLRGLYTVYANWQLGRELEALRRESQARSQASESATHEKDRIAETLLHDEQRAGSSPSIVFPLD